MSAARFLAGHLRQRSRDGAAFSAWALLEAGPPLITGFVVSRIVDAALRAQAGPALGWLAALSAVLLAGAAASRGSVVRLGSLAESLRDRLVDLVVEAALQRALGRAGAAPRAARAQDPAVTQLTMFVETARELFGASLVAIRDSGLVLAAALLGLAALAPAVAAITALAVTAAVALLGGQARAIYDTQQLMATASEQLGGALEDAVRGAGDILACGAGAQVVSEIDVLADRQARLTRALARTGAVRGASIAVGGYLPIIVLLAAGPVLVRDGRVSAGTVIGAIAYLYGYIAPALRALCQNVMSIGVPLHATLSRLLPPVPGDGPATPPGSVPDPRADFGPAAGAPAPAITIEDLAYSYGPQAEPILAGLSAVIEPGEYLAVVGLSGAGKSTFADLLTGLARPQRGRVLLGGRPVAQLSPAELGGLMTLVPQEAYVFTGTLRDNLRYLRPEAADDTLRAAAAAVGGAGLVGRLGGMDAGIRPGDLSAGERQLITLARAWASPAPVVVLDEATSGLDAPLAARAELAFRRRPGTLIVIAHQLGPALRADRVLVMDGPRTRLGTREQLAAVPGYARLIGSWAAGGQAS